MAGVGVGHTPRRASHNYGTASRTKVSCARRTQSAATCRTRRQNRWRSTRRMGRGARRVQPPASTSFEFIDFQGIYGGTEHDTWVRNVLCTPFAERQLDLSQDEMLEIITRLCTAKGEEPEQFFWIQLLKTNLDPRFPTYSTGRASISVTATTPQYVTAGDLETALKPRT